MDVMSQSTELTFLTSVSGVFFPQNQMYQLLKLPAEGLPLIVGHVSHAPWVCLLCSSIP